MTTAGEPNPPKKPAHFNLRTIGPEPLGATPLDEEDLEGLIPDFVATRSDLNQVEFENITKALPGALRQARALGPEGILDIGFMFGLHARMFGDVWKWAGTQRRRVTNIGVEPALIAEQSKLLFDDAKYWLQHQVFDLDNLAVRIHCRLVTVHPFPNGNGRCTRLMADLFLISVDEDPFIWGGSDLNVDGTIRGLYLAALLKAVNDDDYVDLVRFARGQEPST